ncbi:LPS-assembly lipoprotein LptE [Marinobacter sp. C2H3]|uniref:LPS-assembly lipoprotein LptE n=1 Tax=Marinobacter sp. C2H3 TaxID=3119003 RepID=UPI00300F4D83
MAIVSARRLLTAVALLTTAALAGCGFQLRGTSPVPAAVQPLAVNCDSVPQTLCLSLKEQLDLGGVKTAEGEDADYILTLNGFRQDRRASAITARAAAAEYILTQTVAVSLKTRDEVPLIADTTLSVKERYRYDENNVLAKQREQQDLEQNLNDLLAQQVLFRLAPMTAQRIQSLRDEYAASQADAKAAGDGSGQTSP